MSKSIQAPSPAGVRLRVARPVDDRQFEILGPNLRLLRSRWLIHGGGYLSNGMCVTNGSFGKELEKVGVYTAIDDKITREQFFFDGEH